jgi:hypothetical protein
MNWWRMEDGRFWIELVETKQHRIKSCNGCRSGYLEWWKCSQDKSSSSTIPGLRPIHLTVEWRRWNEETIHKLWNWWLLSKDQVRRGVMLFSRRGTIPYNMTEAWISSDNSEYVRVNTSSSGCNLEVDLCGRKGNLYLAYGIFFPSSSGRANVLWRLDEYWIPANPIFQVGKVVEQFQCMLKTHTW